MSKKDLWLRLRGYHFDDLVTPNLWEQIEAKFGRTDASTKAFAYKLANKMGWNKSFALCAVMEYKKFVYLGVVSDFVVTPPAAIDQVWHQHILFSKAYRSFCQDVIEYDFDHNPELLATDDQTAVFNAQYHDTLALYKKEFGFDPPAIIWGVPKFDEQVVDKNSRSKKKKEVYSGSDGSSDYGDVPLYESFDDSASVGFEPHTSFDGFGDGDGGGGGASGSWDDSGSDSGSDAGSSCSSGCSSCGGGD